MKLIFSLMTAVIVLFGSSSVKALTPGYSDYIPSSSVRLDMLGEDSFELISVDTQTVITLNKNIFPKGINSVLFNARTVENDNDIYKSAVEAAEGMFLENPVMFEFSLIDADKNQEIKSFLGKLSVTVACKNGANSVFRFDEKNGKLEDMNGILSSNSKYITFETDHFSYYLLAKTQRANIPTVAKPENTESKKQQSGAEILVAAAVLALGCELLFTLKRLLCR